MTNLSTYSNLHNGQIDSQLLKEFKKQLFLSLRNLNVNYTFITNYSLVINHSMLNIDSNSKTLFSTIKERVLLHLSTFKKTLSSYQKIICAVKLIQFLLIIILLFQYNLFNYIQNLTSPTVINVSIILQQTINHILASIYQTKELLIILASIMTLLIILELGHCFFLETQFKTERHQLLSSKIMIVIVILYFILALIEVPCLYNLGKIYSEAQNAKWMVFICLNAVSFWPFTIIQFTINPIIFDLFVLLIVPILSVTELNYKFVLILVVCLFYSWMKPYKLQKTLYVIIGLISGWNFIDKQLLSFNVNPLAQDKLVLISLSFILLTYLVIKLTSYCQVNQNQHDNQIVLQLIQKSKTQNLLQSNDFETVFKVWSICLKFIQKYDQALINQLKKKQIQHVTKSDLIKCLRQHVRESITSQRDIPNRILYLKLKILQKIKLIEIIEGVQSLMSVATRNTLSIRQQFLLAQFQKYVEDKLFGSDKDRDINTAFLIEKAFDIQQFYKSAAECFRQVIRFWQFLRRRFKSKQDISVFFEKILESENELGCRFEKLSEYRNIGREKKLMIQIEEVLNGHSLVSEYNLRTNENIYSERDRGQEVDNKFLVIEEKRIIKCSFELINQMGYKEEELINANKEIIFGERFVQYLDKQLREVTFQNKRVLIIPVYNKESNILIKQCSILIYPEMKAQVKYLISFTDIHKVTDSSIIIYTPLTDSLQYVTPKFITQFQLNPIKISSKITHDNLLSNQLFTKIDLSSIQTKQLLKQQKPVNCQLILKHFSTINLQKMPINITLINQFSTNTQTFYLLSIKKGTFIKTEMTITQHQETKQYMNNNEENLNLVEKYRNQKFFCPISNNYSIKITQKLSQIADKDRKNFVFYMKALFIFALLLLTAQFTYSYIQSQQRINNLKNDEDLIYNKNNDYIRISDLYSLFFKSEYFRNYPQVLPFINQNLTIEQVSQICIEKMQETVRSFLSDHLNSLRSSTQGNSIQYQLKFDSFEIKTDTSKTTFIDFSYQFSQYVKTHEKQFLFANYLSFRDVAEKFSNIDLSTDEIASTFSSSLFTVYITLIVSIPLTIIGLFISIKIQFSINQMYKLIQLLEQKDSQQVLQKINHLKGKLKEINSIFQKKQQQNRSSKFSTARIIQLTDKVIQEKSNQNEINNIRIKNYNQQKQSEQSEQNEPLSSGNEQKQQKIKLSIDKKPQMESDPILWMALRNIYSVVFLGILGIIIYLQINYRNNQYHIFQSLFKYQKELFQSQGAIFQLQNDFFFKAQNTKFHNSADFVFYQSHSYQSLHSYSNLENRSQFQSFYEKQYKLLFNDLCAQQFNYFFTFQGLNCSTIAGGILPQGYSQTFSMYLKMATQMKNLTLDQFLTQSCANQRCPLFIQEFYLNARLSKLIVDHIAQFRQFFQTIAQNQSTQNGHILVIQLCLMIALSIGFMIWIHLLRKRCRRSIKMFQIIPPYIMKKMKMTTFIRKNDILSCLSVL